MPAALNYGLSDITIVIVGGLYANISTADSDSTEGRTANANGILRRVYTPPSTL